MGWRHTVCISLVIASLYYGSSQETCGGYNARQNRSNTDNVLSFCTESSLNGTHLYMDVSDVSVIGPCVCQLSLAGNTSGEINLQFTTHQNNETRNRISVTVDNMYVNGTKVLVNNSQTVDITLMTEQQPLHANDSVTCIEINADNSTTLNVMCFEYTSVLTTTSNVSDATDEPSGTTQPTIAETSTAEESNTTQMMNKTNERSIFNIGIVIAAAGGGFVILVTMVTLILVSCCKSTKYDYPTDDVFARGDVHMAENQLYNATHSGYRDSVTDPVSSKL